MGGKKIVIPKLERRTEVPDTLAKAFEHGKLDAQPQSAPPKATTTAPPRPSPAPQKQKPAPAPKKKKSADKKVEPQTEGEGRSKLRREESGERITIYLPPELERKVRVHCAAERRSLSNAATEAFTQWLTERGPIDL